MAKNIKGITIDIGGDTSKLQKSLNAVNAPINKINKELKDLNTALKLDPKNTELLAQKQEVLRRNIEASANKLKELKNAQKEMGAYTNLTDEQKAAYNRLSTEIAKSESAIKELNKELKNTNKIDLSGIKEGLKRVGDIALSVTKEVAKISAAVGTALSGVLTASVKEFGEYEQQLGGVEALFKNSANGQQSLNKVLETGENAWKDLTLSQTDYFRTFTSTYPLVKNSIDDENKAIETTNRMLQLESDLANTFGYDISTASNAINWALKGSFNYVDNLNLGIKGTKEGFLEAAKESGYLVKSVDELSSDEILDVLEQYAKKYGVLGRTADEAAKTIQGSYKSMKASLKNFLTGTGGAEQVVETVMNFLGNISNSLNDLAPKILDGIVILFNELTPKIIDLIIDLAPKLIESAFTLIEKIVNAIAKNVKPLIDMVVTILKNIVKFITDNIKIITQAAIDIVVELANGIAESLPVLIPSLIEAILIMVDTLIDNIDLLVDAAFKLMEGLAKGLIAAIPILVEKVPTIKLKLIEKLLEQGGDFLDTGIKFVEKIGKGLIDGVPKALKAVSEFVQDVIEKFLELLGDFFDVGVKLAKAVAKGIASVPLKVAGTGVDIAKSAFDIGADVVGGIGNGIVSTAGAIGNAVGTVGNTIFDGFKGFFGINSPSKLMKNEVGKWIGIGLGDGIIEGIDETEKQVNLAMNQLAGGIESSVNPTINPTANSNPLIIQIENFNNERESDVQQLAQELEFYRRNSALAKGGK